ncbi:helix-turn-helix domain-containing protein [Streptomyces sp. NPDC018711]|uniref:helix-turn-helix domain-containing protein n=1 Tax=Streptomyces sp. NPDC018711 TaxID=3365052 RepID=UPI003793791E
MTPHQQTQAIPAAELTALVTRRLTAQIAAGVYTPERRLPPAATLCTHFMVPAETMHNTLNLLEAQGLVQRIRMKSHDRTVPTRLPAVNLNPVPAAARIDPATRQEIHKAADQAMRRWHHLNRTAQESHTQAWHDLSAMTRLILLATAPETGTPTLAARQAAELIRQRLPAAPWAGAWQTACLASRTRALLTRFPHLLNAPQDMPAMAAHGAAVLRKGGRLTGHDRDAAAFWLAQQYPDHSLRKLAKETGRSYSCIHRLLTMSGVPLRPQGGSHRHAQPAPPSKRTRS